MAIKASGIYNYQWASTHDSDVVDQDGGHTLAKRLAETFTLSL